MWSMSLTWINLPVVKYIVSQRIWSSLSRRESCEMTFLKGWWEVNREKQVASMCSYIAMDDWGQFEFAFDQAGLKFSNPVTTTTTTKPFVLSIWGRLHEPKENYAGSGIWISFLHSFLSSNMPALRPFASISCCIASIHVSLVSPAFFKLALNWYALLVGLVHL